jgi:ankyrin repeat protein
MRSICRDSRYPSSPQQYYNPFQYHTHFKSINKFPSSFKTNLRIQRFYGQKTKQVSDLSGDLIYAASKGDLEKVKTLVQAGATINAGDYDHRTPLHLAASEGHTDVQK